MKDVTVLIEPGNIRWTQHAVNAFDHETKIHVAPYERSLPLVQTDFVLFVPEGTVPSPELIGFLRGLAWNADVVYPTVKWVSEDGQELKEIRLAGAFCRNRLEMEDFIPRLALMRREKATRPPDWELYRELAAAGAHFKACPEAVAISCQVHEMELRPSEAKATFYHQATPATTYLRCQLPARYLPGVVRELPSVRFDFKNGVTAMEEIRGPDDFDISFQDHVGAAIWQFASDQRRAGFMELMMNEGVRCLVETDDNYLVHPGKAILNRSGWAMKIGEKAFTRQGHEVITRRAAGVIVTTEALANAYRKINPNVFVCPNTVDPADWPEPEKPDDGVLRFGWSASRSHTDDIPLVTRAMEWASRQKDVEVYCHGLHPMWTFPFGHIPWDDDVEAYRTRMMHFDVGIAPVRITPFTLGRSDVKALEYTMGGALPLLSDVPPYSLFTHGENCLKAKTAKDFFHQVKWCVQHRDEVKELAAKAREYTLTKRTTAAQIHCWQEAIDA